MLDIKKNNLFLVGSLSATIKILEFYDLMNINWVLFHQKNSNIGVFVKNRKVLYGKTNLTKLVKENLFRIDMIVVESNSDVINILRKHTDIPIIILGTNITSFNQSRYDTIYNIDLKPLTPLSQKLDGYLITDFFSKEQYTLSGIKESKIRDIKLNSILGDDTA